MARWLRAVEPKPPAAKPTTTTTTIMHRTSTVKRRSAAALERLTKPTKGKEMSWRDKYKVHPAANVFPMMSDKELDDVAEDIKANGLRSKVSFFADWMARSRS